MDNRVPGRRAQRGSDSPKPTGGLFGREQVEGVVEAEATPQATVKPTSGGRHKGIRSRYPARIILYAPSGIRYEWGKAGDTVSVSDADVAFVLSKNKTAKQACCGGGERIVFETL